MFLVKLHLGPPCLHWMGRDWGLVDTLTLRSFLRVVGLSKDSDSLCEVQLGLTNCYSNSRQKTQTQIIDDYSQELSPQSTKKDIYNSKSQQLEKLQKWFVKMSEKPKNLNMSRCFPSGWLGSSITEISCSCAARPVKTSKKPTAGDPKKNSESWFLLMVQVPEIPKTWVPSTGFQLPTSTFLFCQISEASTVWGPSLRWGAWDGEEWWTSQDRPFWRWPKV